jgi:hypothetical protein
MGFCEIRVGCMANAVAAMLFSLMPDLSVMRHTVDDVLTDELRCGRSPLGAAVVGPHTLPTTPPRKAQS